MADKFIKRYIIQRVTFNSKEIEIYGREPNDALRTVSLKLYKDGIHSIIIDPSLSIYISDRDGFIIKLINNKEGICKTIRFSIHNIDQKGYKFSIKSFGSKETNESFFYNWCMTIKDQFIKNIFDDIDYDEIIVSIIEPNIYGWN